MTRLPHVIRGVAALHSGPHLALLHHALVLHHLLHRPGLHLALLPRTLLVLPVTLLLPVARVCRAGLQVLLLRRDVSVPVPVH